MTGAGGTKGPAGPGGGAAGAACVAAVAPGGAPIDCAARRELPVADEARLRPPKPPAHALLDLRLRPRSVPQPHVGQLAGEALVVRPARHAEHVLGAADAGRELARGGDELRAVLVDLRVARRVDGRRQVHPLPELERAGSLDEHRVAATEHPEHEGATRRIVVEEEVVERLSVPEVDDPRERLELVEDDPRLDGHALGVVDVHLREVDLVVDAVEEQRLKRLTRRRRRRRRRRWRRGVEVRRVGHPGDRELIGSPDLQHARALERAVPGELREVPRPGLVVADLEGIGAHQGGILERDRAAHRRLQLGGRELLVPHAEISEGAREERLVGRGPLADRHLDRRGQGLLLARLAHPELSVAVDPHQAGVGVLGEGPVRPHVAVVPRLAGPQEAVDARAVLAALEADRAGAVRHADAEYAAALVVERLEQDRRRTPLHARSGPEARGDRHPPRDALRLQRDRVVDAVEARGGELRADRGTGPRTVDVERDRRALAPSLLHGRDVVPANRKRVELEAAAEEPALAAHAEVRTAANDEQGVLAVLRAGEDDPLPGRQRGGDPALDRPGLLHRHRVRHRRGAAELALTEAGPPRVGDPLLEGGVAGVGRRVVAGEAHAALGVDVAELDVALAGGEDRDAARGTNEPEHGAAGDQPAAVDGEVGHRQRAALQALDPVEVRGARRREPGLNGEELGRQILGPLLEHGPLRGVRVEERPEPVESLLRRRELLLLQVGGAPGVGDVAVGLRAG